MSFIIEFKEGLTKNEYYKEFARQLSHILENEPDTISRMATITAALGETRKFLWVGFYRVIENELVLGPFHGPLACFRIQKGRGVCGTAWLEKKSILVANVHDFPGHIACSSLSNSEIVIPIINHQNNVVAVLDVDHTELHGLNEDDLSGLQKIASLTLVSDTSIVIKPAF